MLGTERIGVFRGRYVTASPWQPLTYDRVGRGVAKTAQEWNQPEHLAAFIDRTSLFTLRLQDTRLHFTVSDTPYSDKHIMLVLENDRMIGKKKWDEGLIIHDQSRADRLLYWSSAITTLDSFTKKLNGGGDAIVFTENTCSVVTSDKHRVPRSIGLIHGHVTRFSQSQMMELGYTPDGDVAGLQDEIKLWNEVEESLLYRINSELESKTGRSFRRRESELPTGYYTELDYKGPSIPAVETIDHLLTNHHQIYSTAINEIVNSEQVKPQPSYRTYIEHNPIDNTLRVGISPILISHSGCITASGIFTERLHDPNYPIEKRRRDDADQLVRQIGNQVYNSMTDAGYQAEVLRDNYPY